MPDTGDMAKLADRRQDRERARGAAARLGIAVRAIEIQHLVQPSFDLVPGPFSRLRQMQADRHGGHQAARWIVPEFPQELFVERMAAADTRRHVITAPRRPPNALFPHRGHPDRRSGALHRGCGHMKLRNV
jgi:hypothetical protein